MRPDPHIDTLITPIDKICAFPQKIGTHRIFYYEPLGVPTQHGKEEYRQIAMRKCGCWWPHCVAGIGRDTISSLIKRNPWNRQGALPTVSPNIPGCQLAEPWDYQHVRQRILPNPLMVTTSSETSDIIANTLGSDTTTDLQTAATMLDTISWAKCERCGKWRTTKRRLSEGEYYECSDQTATHLNEYANCEASLEEGAEDDGL